MVIIGRIKELALDIAVKCLECLRNNSITNHSKIYRVFLYLWESFTNSRVYTVVSHKEFTNLHDSFAKTIRNNRKGYYAETIANSAPKESVMHSLPMPDLMLYCHENVSVFSNSDHVLSNRRRLLINDFCSDNLKNKNIVYIDKLTYIIKGRTAIVRKKDSIRCFPAGIMINGKFSFNYYHIIFENLIRLIVMKEVNNMIPSEVPYIIDNEVENIPSFRTIFNILTKDIKRDVIVLNKDEMIDVKKLYCISNVNFLVPKYRDDEKGINSDFVFDKEYVLRLRGQLLNYKSEREFPKRLFLSRQYSTHRQLNEDDIFEILQPYGFVKVAPEKYSFEEQISLFSGAECVIGGSGAAFTNLLFSSKPFFAICLFKNISFLAPVFTTPVTLVGGELCYFLSKDKSSGRTPHTLNYIIDKHDFKQFCEDIIIPKLEDYKS